MPEQKNIKVPISPGAMSEVIAFTFNQYTGNNIPEDFAVLNEHINRIHLTQDSSTAGLLKLHIDDRHVGNITSNRHDNDPYSEISVSFRPLPEFSDRLLPRNRTVKYYRTHA